MSTPPRRVALLRAINVGGRFVKMDRLRELLAPLKLGDLQTFIASGNVLFRSSAAPELLERKFEALLAKELGYKVDTFVRTAEELASVVGHDPFPGEPGPGGALSVAFLKGAPSAEVTERLVRLRTEMDDLHVHGREMYWLSRGRISESKVWRTPFEKVIGGPGTMRNITTVRKLADLLSR